MNSQGCANQFRSRQALRLRPEQAFTLIELLVVIAIIGILAGLLLGGVSRARYMAKLANCRSNLRQFDIAIKDYSNEYDSLPPWLSNLFHKQPNSNFISELWHLFGHISQIKKTLKY